MRPFRPLLVLLAAPFLGVACAHPSTDLFSARVSEDGHPYRPLVGDEDDGSKWTATLVLGIGRHSSHRDLHGAGHAHLRVRSDDGRVWFDGPVPQDIERLSFQLPRNGYEIKVHEHYDDKHARARVTPACIVRADLRNSGPEELKVELGRNGNQCTFTPVPWYPTPDAEKSRRVRVRRTFAAQTPKSPWSMTVAHATTGSKVFAYQVPESVSELQLRVPAQSQSQAVQVTTTSLATGQAPLPNPCTEAGSCVADNRLQRCTTQLWLSDANPRRITHEVQPNGCRADRRFPESG